MSSFFPSLQQSSEVLNLNVGGEIYATTLSTLRKYPGSRLAEMCSAHAKVTTDSKGRLFIDREGTYFKYVLEFLRSEQPPTQFVPEVYREALFYNIEPLVELLKNSPEMYGELIARQQFLAQVPNYRENIEVVMHLARADSVAARQSRVIVCVVKNKEDERKYLEAVNDPDSCKDPVVKFGPWKPSPTVSDLLYCIKLDVENRGHKVSHQPCKAGKGLLKCCHLLYEFVFTWW
ncbi:BTB/POZ domain-containing protein KCTD14-like [Scyliorhinus torazame]|uniref:BTB/POZ domain-containing protein KCTD14-like n=1 Tax=Scyliorhinus torazame TaxID=75743 RepID=UPI003B59A6A5